MEGHLLIVSTEHAPSVLDLGEDSFEAVEVMARGAFSFLQAEYGEAGLFEHGRSALCPEPYARAQFVHAHIHAVPLSARLELQSSGGAISGKHFDRYFFQNTSNKEGEDFYPLWGEGEPHTVRAGILRALRLREDIQNEELGGYTYTLDRRWRTEERWRRWSEALDLKAVTVAESTANPGISRLGVLRKLSYAKANQINVSLKIGE